MAEFVDDARHEPDQIVWADVDPAPIEELPDEAGETPAPQDPNIYLTRFFLLLRLTPAGRPAMLLLQSIG